MSLWCAVAVAVAVWITRPLPSGLLQSRAAPGVVIEDRNGLTLRATRADDGSRSSWVPYDAIDPDVINAFVAVEDRRFWDHHGVDVLAVARATLQNLRARHVVSGASTITMQLARLLRPNDHGWTSKLSQAAWSLRLERSLTKQQIMEQYLNRVHLGQATVGVGAAASLYFATSASVVSIGQAATLAGLAHAPSRDNPYVSSVRSARRRSLALRRMRMLSFVSENDLVAARAEPLVAEPNGVAFLAPHFTTRVLAWTSDADSTPPSEIRTSLDLGLQQQVEAEVRHTVDVMRDRNVQQAAAVVLDNATGEVLAWVGSPDFWSADNGQTDMVVSARQPGSALKPFLYALALDRGYTAATILPDVPTAYATPTGPYQPRNYDRRFHGPTRLREALASSYNVPAVEVASHVGAGSLLNTLRTAGFTSLDRDAEHYGLGLALGNGDVTLIELANAYRGLANGGEWTPWRWTADGALNGAHTGARFASRMSSAIILDILSDPTARVPGFGSETPFDFPFPVAVKTGTSRHFTDNWAVGTTGHFTVAVWAGNFDGHPMQGVSGITGAGPLLYRVVMVTAARYGAGDLLLPSSVGAQQAEVCRASGMLATPACPRLTEWFAPNTAPRESDTWESQGWPAEFAEWRPARKTPPRNVTSVTATARARLEILSPRDGDRYAMPIGVEARYATIALRSTSQDVRWRIDGRPYTRERWALSPGSHEIAAVSARGDSTSVRITVER